MRFAISWLAGCQTGLVVMGSVLEKTYPLVIGLTVLVNVVVVALLVLSSRTHPF